MYNTLNQRHLEGFEDDFKETEINGEQVQSKYFLFRKRTRILLRNENSYNLYLCYEKQTFLVFSGRLGFVLTLLFLPLELLSLLPCLIIVA